MIVLKGRGVVEGRAFGKTLVVDDYISFLGEIERSSGVLRKKGFPETSVAGRILFFKGSKGSTVGPYVMYDLCKRGLAPSAMIVEKADQLVHISNKKDHRDPTYNRMDSSDNSFCVGINIISFLTICDN